MIVRVMTAEGPKEVEHRFRPLSPVQLAREAGVEGGLVDHEFFGKVFAAALKNRGVLEGVKLDEVKLVQFREAGADVYEVIKFYVDSANQYAAYRAHETAQKEKLVDSAVAGALG